MYGASSFRRLIELIELMKIISSPISKLLVTKEQVSVTNDGPLQIYTSEGQSAVRK